MLVDRSLRPDRVTASLTTLIWRILPSRSSYVKYDSTLNSIGILDECISDFIANKPTYFIPSPGANVVADQDDGRETWLS